MLGVVTEKMGVIEILKYYSKMGVTVVVKRHHRQIGWGCCKNTYYR